MKCFLNGGALQPKIVEKILVIFCCMLIVVYLGHDIFYLVAVKVFSKSIFKRGFSHPKLRNLRKTIGATSVVARVP